MSMKSSNSKWKPNQKREPKSYGVVHLLFIYNEFDLQTRPALYQIYGNHADSIRDRDMMNEHFKNEGESAYSIIHSFTISNKLNFSLEDYQKHALFWDDSILLKPNEEDQ